MNKGDNYMVSMILFFLALVIFVAAVFVYTKREDNDYVRYQATVNSLRGDLGSQKKKDEDIEKALHELRTALIGIPNDFKQIREEFDRVQDHCARLREGQIELRDRSYPRKVELKFKPEGAIPVEIYTPTRPLPPLPKKQQKEPVIEKKTKTDAALKKRAKKDGDKRK